jgi:hypothetical protein
MLFQRTAEAFAFGILVAGLVLALPQRSSVNAQLGGGCPACPNQPALCNAINVVAT